MELKDKSCRPCEGSVLKLKPEEIIVFNAQMKSPWVISDNLKISKNFLFRNYNQSIRFVNQVAEIAEAEGHHPVMHVFFSKVLVELWTHAILGLSENDFILASKIDEIV